MRELIAYIFKSILTQLCMDVQESNHWKPGPPEDKTFHALDIYDAKDKDKFVEYKIPELVFDVLQLWYPQLTKHLLL